MKKPVEPTNSSNNQYPPNPNKKKNTKGLDPKSLV